MFFPGSLSALAFNFAIVPGLGFSLSRIAVISAIVRGGARKPAGSALPGATASAFGLPFLYISMATLALPLAALSAAITQAFIFGNTPALHVARLASRSPPLPIPCMHARTIG